MQTNPAVEQDKNIKWSESPCNRSSRKGKGLQRKGFTKEPSLICVLMQKLSLKTLATLIVLTRAQYPWQSRTVKQTHQPCHYNNQHNFYWILQCWRWTHCACKSFTNSTSAKKNLCC